MMTRMRQMTKGMFVLVGVAFIGLIVFEWGADIRGGGPSTTVGKVNGSELSYSEFNNYYQQTYQNISAQPQGKIDDSQLSLIREQVWNEFIQRTLFTEQMDNLNISVSDSAVPPRGRPLFPRRRSRSSWGTCRYTSRLTLPENGLHIA